MSVFPSEWENGCIGDIAKVISGYAFPSEDFHDNHQEGIPVVRMSDIKDKGLNLGSAKRISNINQEFLRKFQIRQGDLLFGMSGSIDKSALVLNNQQALLNQRVGALRSVQANGNFHAHIFQNERVKSQILDLAAGGAQLNISAKQIESIRIAIPPLPEQKKIAEILSGIDREIESLSKAIGSHRTTRNALIESIFEDGHKKAENGSSEWRVWSIEDLLASTATPMRSGPFGSALLKEELAKEGIPFLGIDNVRTEEFVLTFKRFLTDEKFKELRRYEVFPQDVMITIMGTVGRSCVVPEGIGPCVSSKHTWTMTFDHSKVAPEIICWQLNHYGRTRTKFLESSQGGVMDAISSQTLRETEVPIPTSRLFAEQIVGQYKSSHNHEQTLNKKFHKMRLLKNAVASDLLSGRKRVSI